jgi:hypothetical protein
VRGRCRACVIEFGRGNGSAARSDCSDLQSCSVPSPALALSTAAGKTEQSKASERVGLQIYRRMM